MTSSSTRALPGLSDFAQHLLDDVTRALPVLDNPVRASPPDLDLLVGKVLARRLLVAHPGLAEALRTGTSALVIQVPSPDLVQGMGDGLLCAVFGDPASAEDDDTRDDARSRWTTFWRDGTQRTHVPTDGNLAVRRALSRGQPVVGISTNPDRHLPAELIRAAEHRLQAPELDAASLTAVANLLTGKLPTRPVTDQQARALTVADLALAARPDEDPDAFLERALALAAARTRTPTLTLAMLHGMDEVVRWGEALARDLADYRAGRLAWADVDRGCLLHGPPGTGKTTAAKALAGTCGVPLVTGSFARWQAAGTLDAMLKAMIATFDEARSRAPCILFIDEVDAVGDRRRFTGRNSGYETQVMNGFLEQLDGIQGREGVVVVGACNHPERLDEAVLRPGRLDRSIRIGLPDQAALAGIMRFRLGAELPGADLSRAALMASGASGAQAEQWVRDARKQARHARRSMTLDDLLAAIRSGRPDMAPDLRRRVAVHEVGHALVAALEAPGIVQRVSLLATEDTGGEMVARDEPMLTLAGVHRRLRRLLAGRAAEEIVLGMPSTGSGGDEESDLGLATRVALSALTALGMREGDRRLVWSGFHDAERIPIVLASDPGLAADVAGMLEMAYAQAKQGIRDNRAALDELVVALLNREVLHGAEVDAVIARHRRACAPVNRLADEAPVRA